jgi:hypothetical protein
MAKLTALLEGPRRDAVIADVVAMVECHVQQRSGLRGVTLRAGLAAAKRKLPDAIPRSVTRLLPELLAALDQGKPLAAATLMDIADARVERSTHAAVKSFYARFRKTAEHEAEDLVPALAEVLARHRAA